MAWNGYFEYDGTEIINADRTSTYAQNMALNWLRCGGSDALGPMLGETYQSPYIDDAPWVDPDAAESFDFMGLYPLDVVGLEDSTVSATVIQSVLDGGVVQRPRRTTRTVVFSAVLIGSHECGVEYGMRWLRSVLSGAPCQGAQSCGGAQLCYLACEPSLGVGQCDEETALVSMDPILRSIHKVTVTTGPIITAKMALPSGGNAWAVSWTMVAGSPYEFMTEQGVVHDFPNEEFYDNPAFNFGALPADWEGTPTVEYPCITPQYRPLYDPDCPLVIAPPSVPSIAVSCFNFPTSYGRRFFTIPEEMIPMWGSAAPIVILRTGQDAVRALRMRFYADVLETGDPDVDPCAYCGDIVFSYIPRDSILTFDGVDQVVWVDTPGQLRRRADAVVFKSDGTPFEWPELSCGFNYLAVFDYAAEGETIGWPFITLSLTGKVT